MRSVANHALEHNPDQFVHREIVVPAWMMEDARGVTFIHTS
jgi:hypothetical protein